MAVAKSSVAWRIGNFEKLLHWQKTDLLPMNPKFDGITLRSYACMLLIFLFVKNITYF